MIKGKIREARRKKKGHENETMIDRLNKKHKRENGHPAMGAKKKNFPKVCQRQRNPFAHNDLRGLLFGLYL